MPNLDIRPLTHQADERRFLDERGSSVPLAPNGLNPATILEKAVRERITDSYFWKEQCFGLNEADVIDRVVDYVTFVGGVYGVTQKPSPFLCLGLKMLQLAPGDDILAEYLVHGGEKFKYLRALAAFYVRLTRNDKDVYTLLEPFLQDRRKLRRRLGAGKTVLTYVDEFVDELLTRERVCSTSLWKMRKRELLEDLDMLEPRVSPLGSLEDILDDEDEVVEEIGMEYAMAGEARSSRDPSSSRPVNGGDNRADTLDTDKDHDGRTNDDTTHWSED